MYSINISLVNQILADRRRSKRTNGGRISIPLPQVIDQRIFRLHFFFFCVNFKIMTDKHPSTMGDMTQSIPIDPAALLTTSTINALHFPDLTTSGISDAGGGGGKGISLNLEGVGMCDSIMTESFCEASTHDDVNLINTNTNGLHTDNSMTTSFKSLSKKDSNAAQKKRRSRKAQYDAVVDGVSLDKIDTVNLNDEFNESDDAW